MAVAATAVGGPQAGAYTPTLTGKAVGGALKGKMTAAGSVCERHAAAFGALSGDVAADEMWHLATMEAVGPAAARVGPSGSCSPRQSLALYSRILSGACKVWRTHHLQAPVDAYFLSVRLTSQFGGACKCCRQSAEMRCMTWQEQSVRPWVQVHGAAGVTVPHRLEVKALGNGAASELEVGRHRSNAGYRSNPMIKVTPPPEICISTKYFCERTFNSIFLSQIPDSYLFGPLTATSCCKIVFFVFFVFDSWVSSRESTVPRDTIFDLCHNNA